MHPPEIARIFGEAYVRFRHDNALRLSAALAYYAVFSLAPLLLIVTAVAGFFFGEEAVRGQLQEQLKGSLGASGAFVVQDMIAHVGGSEKNALVSLGGFAMLLFGAGGVFGELQDSLNVIWDVKRQESGAIRAMLKDRFLSFAMVLGIGFLLLCSMILSAIILALSQYLGRLAELPTEMWSLFNEIASFLVVSLLFASIYKVLPDSVVPWRCVWMGAMIAALLFVAGKFGIAWYLGREATISHYGNAGALALVLIWIYFSSIILYGGAEIARVCHLHRESGEKVGKECGCD